MSCLVRKANRLRNYDYSQGGAYFITICSKNKEKIFGTVLEDENASNPVGAAFCRPHLILTKVGKIVEAEIQRLISIYKTNIAVNFYIVMPNHIHLLIEIKCGRQNAAPTISRKINQWKRAVSIKAGY